MKKYGRLFKYLGYHKKNVVLYILFTILAIVFSLLSISTLPFFMKLIFLKEKLVLEKPEGSWNVIQYVNYQISLFIKNNGADTSAYIKTLGIICIAVIVATFLKNLFLYLSYYILSPMKMSIIARLRMEVYNKLLVLPIDYFTETRKGDVMSRMTNDIGEIEISVVGTLEGFVRDPFNIIVILASLIYISPNLSLFLLIFLPVTGFIIGRISRSLKKQSNTAAEKFGESLSILEETLGGLRVIKAFNAEKLLRGTFTKSNNELFTIRNKMQIRRDLASPMSEFLGVMVLAGILWFGGRLVLNGTGLEAESFILYIGLFTQIINPAKTLSTSFYNMQKGSAAIARIEEILNAPVHVEDKEDGKQLQAFQSSIEFRNVSFKYDDVIILNNINLKIEKGKTVALVGSSGAGKSTLADLVPRFHDATSGEILIDGVNIKEYTLHSLRNQISIVTQEPILFNDTIANNISLGKQDATRSEIEDAARVANAYNFIINKEEQFNENIGDRGGKLSGGERQRMTIARAVLKNPPILILDEATSSLDTESERLVQDAINNMMQNRTSIVIAHRLSTIRHADEIIVLQKGQIAERGTHDQLLAHDGIYRKLVEMQEVK